MASQVQLTVCFYGVSGVEISPPTILSLPLQYTFPFVSILPANKCNKWSHCFVLALPMESSHSPGEVHIYCDLGLERGQVESNQHVYSQKVSQGVHGRGSVYDADLGPTQQTPDTTNATNPCMAKRTM